MNRTFDFYEYAGILVPGAILIVGFTWLFPDIAPLLSKEGVTVGEFGVFVLIAYAAGQLLQGIGNLIEQVYWRLCGGLPSTRMLKQGAYLDPHQHEYLLEQLRSNFKTTHADISKKRHVLQLPVVRQLYAAIADANRNRRIDIFLGNYGLARGLAAAIFVLLIVELTSSKGLILGGILLALFVLALQRMHRFGRHYATELATQYISLVADRQKQNAP